MNIYWKIVLLLLVLRIDILLAQPTSDRPATAAERRAAIQRLQNIRNLNRRRSFLQTRMNHISRYMDALSEFFTARSRIYRDQGNYHRFHLDMTSLHGRTQRIILDDTVNPPQGLGPCLRNTSCDPSSYWQELRQLELDLKTMDARLHGIDEDCTFCMANLLGDWDPNVIRQSETESSLRTARERLRNPFPEQPINGEPVVDPARLAEVIGEDEPAEAQSSGPALQAQRTERNTRTQETSSRGQRRQWSRNQRLRLRSLRRRLDSATSEIRETIPAASTEGSAALPSIEIPSPPQESPPAEVRSIEQLKRFSYNQMRQSGSSGRIPFDWALYSLEYEVNNTVPPMSQETYDNLRENWQSTLTDLRTRLQDVTDPLDKVRLVTDTIIQNYVGLYNRDQLMLHLALQGQGGNCQVSTQLVITALSELNITLPDHLNLGVQVFSDHVQPVIYDSQRNEVYDLIGNEIITAVDGPIFRPSFILRQHLETLRDKEPALNYGELVSARSLMIRDMDSEFRQPSDSPSLTPLQLSRILSGQSQRQEDNVAWEIPGLRTRAYSAGMPPQFSTIRPSSGRRPRRTPPRERELTNGSGSRPNQGTDSNSISNAIETDPRVRLLERLGSPQMLQRVETLAQQATLREPNCSFRPGGHVDNFSRSSQRELTSNGATRLLYQQILASDNELNILREQLSNPHQSSEEEQADYFFNTMKRLTSIVRSCEVAMELIDQHYLHQNCSNMMGHCQIEAREALRPTIQALADQIYEHPEYFLQTFGQAAEYFMTNTFGNLRYFDQYVHLIETVDYHRETFLPLMDLLANRRLVTYQRPRFQGTGEEQAAGSDGDEEGSGENEMPPIRVRLLTGPAAEQLRNRPINQSQRTEGEETPHNEETQTPRRRTRQGPLYVNPNVGRFFALHYRRNNSRFPHRDLINRFNFNNERGVRDVRNFLRAGGTPPEEIIFNNEGTIQTSCGPINEHQRNMLIAYTENTADRLIDQFSGHNRMGYGAINETMAHNAVENVFRGAMMCEVLRLSTCCVERHQRMLFSSPSDALGQPGRANYGMMTGAPPSFPEGQESAYDELRRIYNSAGMSQSMLFNGL